MFILFVKAILRCCQNDFFCPTRVKFFFCHLKINDALGPRGLHQRNELCPFLDKVTFLKAALPASHSGEKFGMNRNQQISPLGPVSPA